MRAVCIVVRVAIRMNRQILTPSRLKDVSAVYSYTQKANLTSTGGKVFKRDQPEKDAGYFSKISRLWRDKAEDVFHDNSKLIVVEGNLATGKSEFAKKLAYEFDMMCIPDATEEEIFWHPGLKCDLRHTNEVLPEGAKFSDFAAFLAFSNPQQLGMVRTQVLGLKRRMDHYMIGSRHLLNTGQGVVIDRSVYGDIVYAAALFQHGYMTHEEFKLFGNISNYFMRLLWRPHLFIYLGAPAEFIKDRIQNRAASEEVNSSVTLLSEKFIKNIDTIYRLKFLKDISKNCEIVEYDASNLPEWSSIIKDLEKLDLDPVSGEEMKFIDWLNVFGNEKKTYKKFLNSTEWDYEQEFYQKLLPKCWKDNKGEQYMQSIEDFLKSNK